MRVLFGIQLNGNGHATRSSQLITALKSAGADVDVVTSGNNSQVEIPHQIKRHYEGLTMHLDGRGSVDWYRTLKNANVKQFLKDIKTDVREYDVVVSDFEPISAWSARKCRVRSFGFGNQYAISLGKTAKPTKKDYLSELFIKRFARCERYIPLTYEGIDGTFQPLIDKSLFEAQKEGDFTLVYLPAMSTEAIMHTLSNKRFSDHKFKVYCKDYQGQADNVELIRVGTPTFKQDLAQCEGIITAGGFSTTSEALALGKKLWSIPMRRQYEQLCNAIQLKKMGVMTEGFYEESLADWLNNWNTIGLVWEDPTARIVKEIIG